jgi:hypothetical protein
MVAMPASISHLQPTHDQVTSPVCLTGDELVGGPPSATIVQRW